MRAIIVPSGSIECVVLLAAMYMCVCGRTTTIIVPRLHAPVVSLRQQVQRTLIKYNFRYDLGVAGAAMAYRLCTWLTFSPVRVMASRLKWRTSQRSIQYHVTCTEVQHLCPVACLQ